MTAADDFPGLARVAAALATPVAGGEYVWGIVPFRHMIETRSVDIVVIDLARVGGVSQWWDEGRRHGRGVQPAGGEPRHAGDAAAHGRGLPNGLTVEYMPWMLALDEETPAIENGQLVLPTKPGLGLKFDEKAIASFKA